MSLRFNSIQQDSNLRKVSDVPILQGLHWLRLSSFMCIYWTLRVLTDLGCGRVSLGPLCSLK